MGQAWRTLSGFVSLFFLILSGNASGVADTGRHAVSKSIEGIEMIRTEMEHITHSIMALNEQGQAIAEIISTVNDLAERSNLLAGGRYRTTRARPKRSSQPS